ncbi:hypothetical protein JEQ12_005779 [Ovis aries]|uniref:Uncharacterized protein n=1 Tax=Ovis aries TaxID=9940 RepID=A0A836A1Z4_SHEEP|nr:hypothetical protein JEQ12_005779 [Ovis aries]
MQIQCCGPALFQDVRSGLGTREGSDRGRRGATLLTEKNLNQAVGPQAPGFPLADPTSLTSWSHVLHEQGPMAVAEMLMDPVQVR